MTDRDTKKLTEEPEPRRAGGVLVSSLHARGTVAPQKQRGRKAEGKAASAPPPDPFDDDGLDDVLGNAVGGVSEPRLLLVDKLISGTRVRREV